MKGQLQMRRVFEMLEVRNLLSINPTLTQPYTPDEISSAYGADNISFGPAGSTFGGEGEGQTILIIGDYGDDKYLVNSSDKTATTLYPITYAKSDMSLFENNIGFGIINGFTVVGPDGTAGSRPSWKGDSAFTSGDREYAMEVEWARVMAPEANIVLMELPRGEVPSEAITVGVKATGADVVVMGTDDDYEDQIVPGLPVSDFNQAGVTFVAASGDNGTPVGGPSDYPNVIDVGASDLSLNNDQYETTFDGDTYTVDSSSYNSETGWSNPAPGEGDDDEGGSGGGYTLFPASDAPYQDGLVIHDGNQIVSNNGERVTPDVSFVGGGALSQSPNTVEIYSQGKLTTDGGTSLSAVCFAGLVAIADEGLEDGGYDSLTKTDYGGYSPLSTMQTLEAMYNLPSYDYHDITSGFNGYSAGPGYDMDSGLGTPIANQWVPDLARAAAQVESDSSAAGNIVYTPLNYEAPEVYASAAATTAIPNAMTLELNGSMIDIYDNSTGTPGLGTLVAADPLVSTSEININGGDYATNSLTVNFATGNMIPAGGLYFDGVSYDVGDEFGTPVTGAGSVVGAPSLLIEGQLPDNAPGATSTGVWTSETVRPLSPTTGLITLGGVYNINYSGFPSPGLITAETATETDETIVDTTPAEDVTYIALGSNIDTITLLQGPIINGVQSSSYESSGGTLNQIQLFTPVDFLNKTGVTVADADGSDTCLINFTNGNPLPASGLTFNGGTGLNTVTVMGNATGNNNITLGASGVSDTTLGGGALNFVNEQNFNLYGGSGHNVFTVTNWTGTGTIYGDNQKNMTNKTYAGGNSTVEVEKSANMGVNGNIVGSSDGMLITETDIAATVLEGMSGNVSYTVNAWNANSGTLYLNGFATNNTYYVGTPQTENLDTIKQIVDINARGTANTIILYDQKNNSFVDYVMSSTSIGSTLQTLQGGGPRPQGFQGVTVKSGSLQNVTLNANKSGSVFGLTPSTSTTFVVNGAANAPTANYLNVNFAGAQSPTLFNTNASGSNGIFMFANDGGVQFTNMASFDPTDYTGSVGAVNAIAATAGANSLPTVQIVNSVTGQTLQTLTNVFPSGYSGGVQVAIGNVVAGSGIPDLIVAPGVGQAPFIKIYSVLTGALIESFLAQSSAYNYGLQVAVGDVTGNGLQDIITAPLVGAATVYVFKNTGSTTTPFTAYSATTPNFTAFTNIAGYEGGVGGLAVGNVTANPATSGNPNGAGDIIVGSGIGTPAIAQVFNYYSNGVSSTPAKTITPTFSASDLGGISVAVADVNGDGVPDVVMGTGANGGSLIDVWSGKTGTIASQFTAFTGAGSNAPVHVAIAKISAGVNDILATQGINAQSHTINTFTGSGAAVDTVMESSLYLDDGINLG